MALNQILTGPQQVGDAATITGRAGRQGDAIVSELHGRFYEANYRGALFSGGTATLLSISNVTFAIATLGATCTPIIGLWNPLTSQVNLVVAQATLALTVTAATATGAGPFYWAASVGNGALTLGTIGFNRKSWAQNSVGQWFSANALTGQTNALTVRGGSALAAGAMEGYSFVGTAVGAQTALAASAENFDGSVIVPPGGILALLAANTPVAHSGCASIMWEEVPL